MSDHEALLDRLEWARKRAIDKAQQPERVAREEAERLARLRAIADRLPGGARAKD